MAESTESAATADTPSTDEAAPDAAGETTESELSDAGKRALDEERKARRDADKARKALEKELADLRKTTMSETEKAIEEARTAGRREALTEAGAKIAAAEIRASATGRMADEQVATLLENVNLSRFVTDDGEVDRDAVVKFVDGIAPQPSGDEPAVPVLDLGQGTRNAGQNAALNGDPLLRSLKDKLGIG